MNLLHHPLTCGIDVDDPQSTILRRRIIQEKGFLRRLYCEWYSLICDRLPSEKTDVLEIGSGAGFLQEFLPQVITSEVFSLAGVERVEDATDLSFEDASLDAIVMTDVLHHVPDVGGFLHEAARTLRDGGRVLMVEPWVTRWSTWVFQNFHHEPFLPETADWRLPDGGPLSMANGALPWMVFVRDRAQFEVQAPELRIASIEPLMPVSYLASGGISMRALLPGVCYRTIRKVERWIGERGAMFALIEVHRLPRKPAPQG